MIKQIGDYLILQSQCLGEGSFGKVYKAVTKEQKIPVAAKVISKSKPSLQEKIQFGQDQQRQINVLKQLNHPAIIDIYSKIESQSNMYFFFTSYIFTELCDGGSLKQLIYKNQMNITQQKIINIMCEIFSGLAYIHNLSIFEQTDIIHRDLKPDNVLLHEGHVKIADFGLARFIQNMKKKVHHTLVGTAYYINPQVLSLQQYSSKFDVWSCGIILFQMLYKKHPFVGKVNYINKNSKLLLQDIKSKCQNKQLQINQPRKVNKKILQLLRGMLQYNQQNRLSLKQIMKLDIINKNERSKIRGYKKLQPQPQPSKKGYKKLQPQPQPSKKGYKKPQPQPQPSKKGYKKPQPQPQPSKNQEFQTILKLTQQYLLMVNHQTNKINLMQKFVDKFQKVSGSIQMDYKVLVYIVFYYAILNLIKHVQNVNQQMKQKNIAKKLKIDEKHVKFVVDNYSQINGFYRKIKNRLNNYQVLKLDLEKVFEQLNNQHSDFYDIYKVLQNPNSKQIRKSMFELLQKAFTTDFNFVKIGLKQFWFFLNQIILSMKVNQNMQNINLKKSDQQTNYLLQTIKLNRIKDIQKFIVEQIR